MTDHTESQQPFGENYEYVNSPQHYRNHPSGIECIELAERLSFCAGNAFKYVFRRGDKGNAVQDLNKALYYANRERQQMEDLIRWRTHQEVGAMLVNDHFTRTDLKNIRKLRSNEPDPLACAIYSRIFDDGAQITHYIESLGFVVGYIQRMIEEIENPSPEDEHPEFAAATTTEN